MNGDTQPSTSPQISPSAPMLPGPKRSVWLWIIFVAVAVVVAGAVLYFVFLPEETVSPTTTVPTENLSGIEEELQGVNLGGLDTELDQIEQELK